MPLDLLLNKNELAKQTLLRYVIVRKRQEAQQKHLQATGQASITGHCSNPTQGYSRGRLSLSLGFILFLSQN